MSDIRVAKDFFETYLPPEILTQIDLSTLDLQNHSFIDEAYKSTQADVVYSVKTMQGQAYCYVLCEQQSKVDSMMAFRLLVYVVRLMELHLKQHSTNILPIVYPLVIYSGDKVWTASLDIYELFGEQCKLAKQIFLQPYQLVDINRINDDELRQHLWSGIMAFALKNKETKHFSQFLETLFIWLNKIEIHDGENFAKIVLRYVLDGISADDEKLLIEKSREYLSSHLHGETMTIAQIIERRGYEKGIQQGKQEKQQIALKLLKKGMSLEEISELIDLPIEALLSCESVSS